MADFDPKRMPPPATHLYQAPPPAISSVPEALLQPMDYGGSPKRLSLDERLERELGIKVEQQPEQLGPPSSLQPHVTSLPATVPTYDNIGLEEPRATPPTEKEQAMAAAQMVTTKLLEMQAAKEAERRRKREQRLAERQRQLQQSQEGAGGEAARGEQRVAAARILEQVELQELASEEQKVLYLHFQAGLWIRIDLIRIRIQHFCSIRIRIKFRIWIRFRIQAKTELSKTISFSNFFEIKICVKSSKKYRCYSSKFFPNSS
jgi:hypothetical protein